MHDAWKSTSALLTAIALSVLVSTATGAETFDDAAAAHERGDHTNAARLMLALAEQGDAKAQYALGVMYVQGSGVPQNDAQAMKWFQHAADQGDARARYNLGVMYSTGQGGRQNYAASDPWIR